MPEKWPNGRRPKLWLGDDALLEENPSSKHPTNNK